MKSKICGISDSKILKYLTGHSSSPQYIGFIINYPKSKRFIEHSKLKKLLKVKKNNSKYVAVLVRPDENFLEKIKNLPFDYYQIYDLSPEKIKKIKDTFNKKIIVAITVKGKNDVFNYKNYQDVADIFLFDGKGYEKSLSFDHQLISNLKLKQKVMIAGNIQIYDDFNGYKKIADTIDISGGLETSGIKDISKINIFLDKIKKINNET